MLEKVVPSTESAMEKGCNLLREQGTIGEEQRMVVERRQSESHGQSRSKYFITNILHWTSSWLRPPSSYPNAIRAL